MTEEFVSLERLCEILFGLRERFYFNRCYEEVELLDALDRELAEDICSEVDLPPYDMATMDGFAIRSGDTPPYKIVSEIYAGATGDLELREREACYITTGAKMPRYADSVLKIEIADIKRGYVYPKDDVPKGKYVLKRGEEIKRGEVVIRKGTRLGPRELAVIKSIGRDRVKVYRKIRVAVFSNGDEIKNGVIKDSNSVLIRALLTKWGCEARYMGVAGDEYEEIKDFITSAVKNYDAVLTSGGVSVGEKDYVIQVLRDIGEVIVHKIRQRPGKPLTIAIVDNKPVFALPGKPSGMLSALLSLRAFFLGDVQPPKIRARIAKEIRLPTSGFSYILFVKMSNGYAIPFGYEGSPVEVFGDESPYEVSLISSMSKVFLSDGYIITDKDIPKNKEVEVCMYDV